MLARWDASKAILQLQNDEAMHPSACICSREPSFGLVHQNSDLQLTDDCIFTREGSLGSSELGTSEVGNGKIG